MPSYLAQCRCHLFVIRYRITCQWRHIRLTYISPNDSSKLRAVEIIDIPGRLAALIPCPGSGSVKVGKRDCKDIIRHLIKYLMYLMYLMKKGTPGKAAINYRGLFALLQIFWNIVKTKDPLEGGTGCHAAVALLRYVVSALAKEYHTYKGCFLPLIPPSGT